MQYLLIILSLLAIAGLVGWTIYAVIWPVRCR